MINIKVIGEDLIALGQKAYLPLKFIDYSEFKKTSYFLDEKNNIVYEVRDGSGIFEPYGKLKKFN